LESFNGKNFYHLSLVKVASLRKRYDIIDSVYFINKQHFTLFKRLHEI